jgi:hypothetical protein
MPSDQSTWLLSAPNDGEAEGLVPEIAGKLAQTSRTFSRSNVAQLNIPTFKVYRTLIHRACSRLDAHIDWHIGLVDSSF